MNVSALIASERYGLPVEVSGYLIVSSLLTYVADSEQETRSATPQRGMIVNRGALAPLESLDLPLRAGTSVTLSGHVTLLGTVVCSGISLLPLYMPHIYELRFRQTADAPEHHIRISEPFCDVYLRRPNQIPSAALRPLAQYLDPQLNILQVRELLLAQDELLLVEHVNGSELRAVRELLDAHGLVYRLERTPIGPLGTP